MRKGDTILEGQYGTKLEILSHVSSKGIATVKVLQPGTMIQGLKKGGVERDFNVQYGLLQFEVLE
jgi:hypothetical protein